MAAFVNDPSAFAPDETITYTYDSNDRLLTEADDAADPAGDAHTVYGYTTPDGRDGTAQASKAVYAGLTGTTTLKSATTFYYDAQGQLARAEVDADGDGTSETVMTYAYGPDGVRVEQAVTENGQTATHAYVVDANNPTGYAQVLEEYVNNALARTYTLGLDVLTQTAPAADGTTLPAGVTAGQPLTLLYDGHGSTRALLDAAHAVIQRFAYDAYGNQLAGSGLIGASAALTSLLYSGEQFDAKLAMQYLRARYFDPQTARFISSDSLEGASKDPMSLHKYLYAESNPIDGADPTGHYDEAGHFWTTYCVAIATGNYTPSAAYRLAYYSQLPDQINDFDAIYNAVNRTNTGTGASGSPPPSSEDAAWAKVVFDSLHSLHGGDPFAVQRRRVVLKDLISNGNLPDWERGFLIHAFGDSYAHTRADDSAYGYPLGHLSAGHSPDIIANNVSKYQEYVQNLYQALGGMNENQNLQLQVILKFANTLPTDSGAAIGMMTKLAKSFGYNFLYVPGAPLDTSLTPPTRDMVRGMAALIEKTGNSFMRPTLPPSYGVPTGGPMSAFGVG